MDLKDKTVTVVGLAKSGVAAARLCLARGAAVRATDAKGREALGEAARQLEEAGVRLFLGGHPDEAVEGVDLVVTSPGVPWEAKPLVQARERGIEVIGELELGWRELAGRIPVIAITGSNGKSTTTALTGHLLKESGVPAWVGGNLGTPFCEYFLERQEQETKWIVLEVSSFMLETVATFKPKIAAVLNVSRNHLDRHPSLEAYAALKARIWQNADDECWTIYNRDDAMVRAMAARAPGRKASFGQGVITPSGDAAESIYVRWPDRFQVEVIVEGRFPAVSFDLKRFPIPGLHNAANVAAASLMARLAGAAPQQLSSRLASFKPLEHRLEKCGGKNGVVFYNDSKATTTAALATSIAVFDKSIVLAGGKDKGGDWRGLREAVKTHVKRLVTFGTAKDLIAEALEGTTDIRVTQTLPSAFAIATKSLAPGDVVLFSPGCASYDQFTNFEERGKKFKELVQQWEAAS